MSRTSLAQAPSNSLSVEILRLVQAGQRYTAESRGTPQPQDNGIAAARENPVFLPGAQLAATEAFDELLLGVYHDVLAPASLARAYAETLLRQGGQMSPEEEESHLRGIVRSLARLSRLVRNILISSRTASQPSDLSRENVDLGKLISQMAREYRLLYGARRVRTNVEKALPLVPGDSAKLEQVVSNLMDNAFKYCSPNSVVRVGARQQLYPIPVCAPGPCTTPCVLVWVSNRMEGLVADDLVELFERFRRGAHQSIAPGTGLGLYLCHSIIVAHGGRIWADCAPKKGMTVSLCLPQDGGPRQLRFQDLTLAPEDLDQS